MVVKLFREHHVLWVLSGKINLKFSSASVALKPKFDLQGFSIFVLTETWILK